MKGNAFNAQLRRAKPWQTRLSRKSLNLCIFASKNTCVKPQTTHRSLLAAHNTLLVLYQHVGPVLAVADHLDVEMKASNSLIYVQIYMYVCAYMVVQMCSFVFVCIYIGVYHRNHQQHHLIICSGSVVPHFSLQLAQH